MSSSNIPLGPCPSLEIAKDAPLFTFNGVSGEGIITSVYDGDSFDVVLDLFGQPTKLKTRLMGLDTPELRTKNMLEKALGYKARDRVRELCLHKKVNIDLLEFEKYGRTMVNVTINDDTLGLVDLTSRLIEENLAQEYEGKTKLGWDNFIQKHHPDLKPYEK